MSQSTYGLVLVNLRDQTFNSESDVQDYIDDCQRTIDMAKDRLKSLVHMTEPKKFISEDTDPLSWLEHEFEEWTELLEEAIANQTKTYLILNAWPKFLNQRGHPEQRMDWLEMSDHQCINGTYVQLYDKNDNKIKIL